MPATRQKSSRKNVSNSISVKTGLGAAKASQNLGRNGNPKIPPTDLPILPFEAVKHFEAFLEENHLSSPGVHVKLARKASGIPSITHDELVEVALCFGWIDSQGHGFDENYHLTRCTPRRSKSIWSQRNVNTVARLLEEDRMRPAGIAAVDAAKADGRWERAYAGPKDITVQKDFQDALDVNEAAQEFFKSLNSTERFAVLWRIDTASLAARAGRISALVQGLAAGQVPGRTKEKKHPSKAEESRVEKTNADKASKRVTGRAKR